MMTIFVQLGPGYTHDKFEKLCWQLSERRRRGLFPKRVLVKKLERIFY